MAVIGSVVSVGTLTGTLIAPYSASSQRTVYLRNDSAAGTLSLGGPDVTTGTLGYKLAPGASLTITLNSDETLYGVISTAVGTIAVLQVHA